MSSLIKIYDILFEEFGHREWWPADTPFEVVVGAMLTQQTRWENVEVAIDKLKAHGLMTPETLAKADTELIEECVRVTGFFRQKAERLSLISKHFATNPVILQKPVKLLRKELLSLKGVGNETADSIVLYAANKPKFVIDAYTTRMLKCVGIEGTYCQLQKLFESELPNDVELFKEYHALIVEYGKHFCNKKRCHECLLRSDF